MFNIFFSSDLHFNHNKEFVYEPRGFQSIEEMNETIIDNFNRRINLNDKLYLLGDIMLGQDIESGLNLLKRINCDDIKIIRGNHDTDNRIAAYKTLSNVTYLGWSDVIKLGKRHYYLSHFPTFVNNFNEAGYYNLYGHTHQQTNFYQEMPMNYHVGVDSHNCCPVSLEEIESDIKDKIEECKNYL